jgi:predicted regulator of Ras-like GTPase activity (Roadblock/LC7/MglB family)
MAEGTSAQGYGRGKALDDLLGSLIQASPDFEGALIVSLDGLVFATAWSSDAPAVRPQGLDDSDIGAVACRAFSQSEQATGLLERGGLDRLILAGSRGNMIITRAGGNSLCVTLLKPEAKLGVASFEAKRISAEVAHVLG